MSGDYDAALREQVGGAELRADGSGAVECPACGKDSDVTYRCEHCGKDLVDEEPAHRDGGLQTEGGRDWAWIVECPHGERTVVDSADADAAAWLNDRDVDLYELTIATWGERTPAVATDGGECAECGARLPDEIEPGTGVYCPKCGHGQHVATDGGERATGARASSELRFDGGRAVEPGHYVVDEDAGVVVSGPHAMRTQAVHDAAARSGGHVVATDDQLDMLEIQGDGLTWAIDDDRELRADGSGLAQDRSEDVDGTLEFANRYVAPICNRQKTATVRYDEGEDVEHGDLLQLETEDGEPFRHVHVRRTATVMAVEALAFMEAVEAKYPAECPQDVIDGLNDHYDGVRPGTIVHVICWEDVDDGLRADGAGEHPGVAVGAAGTPLPRQQRCPTCEALAGSRACYCSDCGTALDEERRATQHTVAELAMRGLEADEDLVEYDDVDAADLGYDDVGIEAARERIEAWLDEVDVDLRGGRDAS